MLEEHGISVDGAALVRDGWRPAMFSKKGGTLERLVSQIP